MWFLFLYSEYTVNKHLESVPPNTGAGEAGQEGPDLEILNTKIILYYYQLW